MDSVVFALFGGETDRTFEKWRLTRHYMKWQKGSICMYQDILTLAITEQLINGRI